MTDVELPLSQTAGKPFPQPLSSPSGPLPHPLEPTEQLSLEAAQAYLQSLAAFSAPASAPPRPSPTLYSSDSSGRMPGDMYRKLLEQLPVVAFTARLGEGLSGVYVSPQIESLLGFSQREWLENPILWYERLHPDDRKRWNEEFSHFLLLDAPLRSVYRFIARDGRVVWVRGEVRIVREGANGPVYVQGIGYDITEIKQADEALKQAHDLLEQRVQERTAQLASANEILQREIEERQRAEAALLRQAEDLRAQRREIEALNHRLQRAVAETHHRVKNSLQVIGALIDLRCMEDSECVPVEEVKRIGTQVASLAVVHNILTRYARQNAEVDTLSAREVLGQLGALLGPISGGRPLDIQIEDAHLTSKQLSALAVVINELVANSVKHAEGRIEVRFHLQEDRAVLEVADNGPGFPQNFNLQEASHHGLELVEQVARFDLLGDLRFENRPQGGAQITITMPLQTR